MVLFVFVIMLLNAGEEVHKGRSLMASLMGAPVLSRCSRLLAWFVQRIYPQSAGVHFGGFTGGRPGGHRPRAVYHLPAAVRDHFHPGC